MSIDNLEISGEINFFNQENYDQNRFDNLQEDKKKVDETFVETFPTKTTDYEMENKKENYANENDHEEIIINKQTDNLIISENTIYDNHNQSEPKNDQPNYEEYFNTSKNYHNYSPFKSETTELQHDTVIYLTQRLEDSVINLFNSEKSKRSDEHSISNNIASEQDDDEEEECSNLATHSNSIRNSDTSEDSSTLMKKKRARLSSNLSLDSEEEIVTDSISDSTHSLCKAKKKRGKRVTKNQLSPDSTHSLCKEKRKRAKRETKNQLLLQCYSKGNKTRLDAIAKLIKCFTFKDFSHKIIEFEKIKKYENINEELKAVLHTIRENLTVEVKKEINQEIFDMSIKQILIHLYEEKDKEDTKYKNLKKLHKIKNLDNFFKNLKPESAKLFDKTYGSYLELVKENHKGEVEEFLNKIEVNDEKDEMYKRNVTAILSKPREYYFDKKIKKVFK